MSAQNNHPVGISYDRDLVDENSYIGRELTVPIGVARTRDKNDRRAGQEVYAEIVNGVTIRSTDGGPAWILEPPRPNDPILREILEFNPDDPKPTIIETHCTGVLRLSQAVDGFRSTLTASSLNAQAPQAIHGDGFNGHNTPPPTTTNQIIIQGGKDVAGQAKGPLRKLVGLNGGGH